jgi:hypothetical protein
MAKSLSQQTVRAFALIGARARLASLQAEVEALYKSFPELRGRAARAARGAAAPRRRRRRKMTAEQKQAVAERMKRYWANRRKEKSK